MSSPSTTPSLHAPRILCLHGGGVNSSIFRTQCRALIKHLPHFRLVFADGPWFCSAGPGIFPVYADCGPFRRWLRWTPDHPPIDDEAAVEEILYEIERCQREDTERHGATGEWVGLLGFSQGAKVAASLAFDEQIRRERGIGRGEGEGEKEDGRTKTNKYQFAVLMAGRNPLVSLGEYSKDPALVSAGQMSEGFEYEGISPHILRLPTLHVHGLMDEGLHLHRKLLRQYCDPQTADVIEWDGGHRIPIKWEDVKPITEWIYRTARREGVVIDVEEEEDV